jgi:hypothetical protein
VSPGLFSVLAAAAAVASASSPATSADGRRAVAVGDLPAVAVSAPARRIDLGNNGPVDGLAWLSGGRLAVVTAKQAVLHILEPSGYRSARWELRATAMAVTSTGPFAAVLLAPTEHAGTARLALLDSRRRDAPPRIVRLSGIRAGGAPHRPWTPAVVAVHGGRFLVAGSGRIATVTPATGAVRMRRVPQLRPSRGVTALALRAGRTIAFAGPDLLYVDFLRRRVRRIATGVDFMEPWRGGVLTSGYGRATAWDAYGRRTFTRRLRPDEFISPTPDHRRLVLARYTSNGVDLRRTLNP